MTSRTQTMDAMFDTIGLDGLDALVSEGCRRGLTVRQIADKLNIPLGDAKSFAFSHENERPLKAGDRIKLFVWPWPEQPRCKHKKGCATVVQDQSGDTLMVARDGYPPEDRFSVRRDQVEQIHAPLLYPAGMTFSDDGWPVIPCELTPRGTQLKFYCPHCKRWHFHGALDGHRVSHCFEDDSPIERGYYIFTKH